MSIASEITRIKDNIADAYYAIEAKGGTVPSQANSDNLADSITSIPGEKTKYGISIDDMFGDVNASGAYSFPNTQFTPDFSGIKTINNDYAFYYRWYTSDRRSTGPAGVIKFGLISASASNVFSTAFCNKLGVTGIDLSKLVTVTGQNYFYQTFRGCANNVSCDLSSLESVISSSGLGSTCRDQSKLVTLKIGKLKIVNGSSAIAAFAQDCSSLKSVDLSSLEEIHGSSAASGAFNGCDLNEIEFTSLKIVDGSSCMATMFANNKNMVGAYFPSLEQVLPAATQNQFNNMFQNNTNMTEIHFPAAMQSRISQMTGYANKFGATNATIYFDL